MAYSHVLVNVGRALALFQGHINLSCTRTTISRLMLGVESSEVKYNTRYNSEDMQWEYGEKANTTIFDVKYLPVHLRSVPSSGGRTGQMCN